MLTLVGLQHDHLAVYGDRPPQHERTLESTIEYVKSAGNYTVEMNLVCDIILMYPVGSYTATLHITGTVAEMRLLRETLNIPNLN